MSVEFETGNLVERLEQTELHNERQKGPDEERVGLFRDLLNRGLIYPLGIDLEDSHAGEEMQRFEDKVMTISGIDVDTQIEQLRKLFERFTPGICKGTDEYNHEFSKFLSDRGYELNTPIEKQLKSSGRVMYFPIGIGEDGRLIVVKNLYFPEELQYEMLTASEWKLLSSKARRVLRNSRLTAMGLSVGSENVAAALAAGITDFDIGDPGFVHNDAEGRLGEFGYDREFLGVNKTALVVLKLLERYPYAKVRAYYDGVTRENYQDIFDPMKMKTQDAGIWIISEEVDNFSAKVLMRRGVYGLPEWIDWHLFMLGDVGSRVTFSHEQRGDTPFHGYIEKMMSARGMDADPYGEGLPLENPEIGFTALVASIGGLSGVPEPLLGMLAKREIGQHSEARITRVPQSREATLLAGAAFSSAVRLLAEGKDVVPYAVLDVRSQLQSAIDNKELEGELDLQRRLNQALFGIPSLID